MNRIFKSLFAVSLILLGCATAPQPVDAEITATKESKAMINADRLPPPEVKPVVIEQVKYEVVHWGKNRGLDQNGGYISATDLSTNQGLWVLQIYSTKYDPNMEEDVQDVFIKSLSKVWFKHQLKIINEDDEIYLLDLDSKSVTRVK